jgi:hypothetical protein
MRELRPPYFQPLDDRRWRSTYLWSAKHFTTTCAPLVTPSGQGEEVKVWELVVQQDPTGNNKTVNKG